MQRLIDADAFRREIDTYPPFDKETQDSNAMANLAKDILLVALNNMPTVDAEPVRHGKWIEYPIADGMNQCSACGVLRFGESNYCPNCGARMDEE